MKTSRILPLAALALGLLFTTASSARTIEICFKDLGCFKIKRAPPPDQCDQTEHCNENACWCGPADALEWPGEDESGLPLLAREAEDAGILAVILAVLAALGWLAAALTATIAVITAFRIKD